MIKLEYIIQSKQVTTIVKETISKGITIFFEIKNGI